MTSMFRLKIFNLSSDRLIELINKFPHATECLHKEAYSFIKTMQEIMPDVK